MNLLKRMMQARRRREAVRFNDLAIRDVMVLDWSGLVEEMARLGLRLRALPRGAVLSQVNQDFGSWTVVFTPQHTVGDLRREARFRLCIDTAAPEDPRTPRWVWLVVLVLMGAALAGAVWLGGAFLRAETAGRMDAGKEAGR